MTILLFRGLAAPPAPAAFPSVTIEALFNGSVWTDISQYFDTGGGGTISITRGSSRVESPVIRYDAGTATIPLFNGDRRFDPTNLAGPYVAGGKTQILPMVPVRISATYQAVTYRLFKGTADSWTVGYSPPFDSVTQLACTDGFKILGIQARKAKTSFLGGGEDTGARIRRILDDCGWPSGDRSITDGDATLQPSLLGGTPAGVVPTAVSQAGGAQQSNVQNSAPTTAPIDELQLSADSEMGELYINGNGLLFFRHRQGIYFDTRSTTSQATFGDDPAVPTTELPYASVNVAYDDTTLWNGAVVANAGGIVQTAADGPSQAAYQAHVYDNESLIADSDFQALAYAQFIVADGKDPELRFSDLTIDPVAQPADLWPQVLGREIGDRITIKRRPPGGGSVISRAVFIRGISHTFTESAWSLTWTLQDVTVPPLLLLDGSMNWDGTHPYGF
jgi:hypothetical protein